MSKEIVPQAFESQEFGTIRAMRGDGGEPWFVASDIAKILGYRDAAQLVRLLDDDEKGTQILSTHGGEQKMTIVNESGFYRSIMQRRSSWVKDEKKREFVIAFQRWVTHDVLPSIRREGAYVASDGTEDDSTLMARALIAAQRAIDRNKACIAELEAKVAEQAPKAGMFDACMDGERWMSVTEASRLLHQYDRTITRSRLFELMAHDGVITRDRQASKEGIDRGYVVNYQPPACFNQKTGEAMRPKPYAKVTSKGLDWALRRYCGREVA